MHANSRQQSPIEGSISHHTFSRGNCSAYGAAAKKNENWTTISDRQERRRVQNRIAQRAYRQKLKERLQLLERRAAQLSSSSSSTTSPKQCQNLFNDEACYSHMPSNASSSSDDHCHHCSHVNSRHGTASPPTSYSSHSTNMSHSPNMQTQRPDMLPYYQDLHQHQQPMYSAPLDMTSSYITEGPQDLGLGFPYLQSYVDMPILKFEDDLPSAFMNC